MNTALVTEVYSKKHGFWHLWQYEVTTAPLATSARAAFSGSKRAARLLRRVRRTGSEIDSSA